MSFILAVDQSTSATKALLFNTFGKLLDKAAVPHRQIYPQPGWVEHDAAEIFANTLQAIKTILSRNQQLNQGLLCFSITNQRETIVVFDSHTGEPLHNAIVWQCRRGEPLCTELIEGGYGEQVHRSTGLMIDTYFPASKLKWLLDNHPDIKQRIFDGRALVGTIDTYLIFRLTHGEIFATDQTNASRTLLYDIRRLSWDEELCRLFGLPVKALPDVLDSSARFGTTDLEGLLSEPIPICGVMGDSQAALFAQRCFSPGSAKVTFGSGSSVLLNIGNRMALSNNGIVTTLGWVFDGQPTYAFEGITNFTGATINWLRDQLGLITDVNETEDLASAIPDNGGVYLVPAFVGLSAPYWQPKAKAAILGLTPASTKSHVVRAALESIAYRIRDVLHLMAKEAGVTLQYVYADGGAVKNRFLMQYVADIIQLTVRAAIVPELSALGAVLSGALGMGEFNSIDTLRNLPQDFVDYKSAMTPERAADYYNGWQNAVGQVLADQAL